MEAFTYSNARQNLARLLDLALKRGEVRIRRRDGTSFIIKPENRRSAKSPFDVKGVDKKGIGVGEILKAIKDSRKESIDYRNKSSLFSPCKIKSPTQIERESDALSVVTEGMN